MTDYERPVARVNLAARSVVQNSGGDSTAAKLVSIIEKAGEIKAYRVQAHALELSSAFDS